MFQMPVWLGELTQDSAGCSGIGATLNLVYCYVAEQGGGRHGAS